MISSAKRGKNERQSLHMWHPYYAGYSESFVLSVIDAEKLQSSAIVLDPWMGSGTTGLVCQKRNINCIGADINPVMGCFAAAKSYAVIPELNKCGINILNEIIDNFSKNSHGLSKKIKTGQQAEMHIKKLYNTITEYFGNPQQNTPMSALSSFFYSTLFFTSRKSLDINSGSNPTWVVDNKIKGKNIKIDLLSEFRENFSAMLGQLNEYFKDVNCTSDYSIYNADCKSLPLNESSVDLIITSPPYLTRIDYAASTKIELKIAYTEEKYKEIRRNSMGTTTVPKNQDLFDVRWGNICGDILKRVMCHKSRASDTYYIKNKSRYFSDTFSALNEIHRVLKKGGSAYLALQNSYYKEIEIPLYDIYCEMAINIGFTSASTVHTEKVRMTLGQINPKSSIYLKDKIYYENIIKVTK